MRKSNLLLLGLSVVFFWIDCNISALEMVKSIDNLGRPRMFVHFINIPSGEAVYIEFPDAGEMLIYGGNKDDAKEVIGYLYELFQEKAGNFVSTFRDMLGWSQKINTVIIRYPGEDALGGVVDVLDKMEVENLYGPLEEKGKVTVPYLGVPEYLLAFHLYLNPLAHKTRGFTGTVRARKSITKYKNSVYQNKIGTPEQIESDVGVEVINPPSVVPYSQYIDNREDSVWIEKNAVVLRLRFNKVKFLFIGNIENIRSSKVSELNSSLLESDIVEISSQSSEYPEVLDKIKPRVIVFSKGEKETKDIYSGKLGYKPQLYSFYERTKLIFITDGKKIFVR